MIRVERAYKLPEVPLSAYARAEFNSTVNAASKASYMIKHSKCWIVYCEGRPMFMVGLLKMTMLGFGTRVWFIAFSGFHHLYMRMVKFLRRGTRRLVKYAGVLSTAIDLDVKQNVRFAEFLGFRRMGNAFYENGARLQYFELRYSHGVA